ncbi:MAG: DUF2971 domain-containing protein [Saprospiraceae bacterium]|nr:DUF2971 domain-containing protein [Saprospiraceae bacterium]
MNEYINKLFQENSKDVPNYLYKYTSFKWAKKTVEDQQIFINNPIKMNDPYEFSPTYTIDYGNKDVIKICDFFFGIDSGLVEHDDSIILKPPTIENIITIEKFLVEFKKAPRESVEKYFIPVIHSIIEDFKKHSKMISFSQSNDINLLWSHYADSHKGCCLEFNISCLPIGQIAFFRKVVYSNDPIDVRLFDIVLNQPQFLLKLVKTQVTKTKDWEYENEWRLVFAGINNYYKDFTHLDFSRTNGFLNSIIFGINAQDSEIEEMINLVKGTHVKVLKREQEMVNDRNINHKLLN